MNAALVYVLAILAAPVLWALGLGANELVHELRKRRVQRRQAAPVTTVAEIIQRVEAERFVADMQQRYSRWPVAGYTPTAYRARDDDVDWQPLPHQERLSGRTAARDRQGRERYWPTCDQDGDFVTDELPRTASPRVSTSRTHDHHQTNTQCPVCRRPRRTPDERTP